MMRIIDESNYTEHGIGAKAGSLFLAKEKGIRVPAFFCVGFDAGEGLPQSAGGQFAGADGAAVRALELGEAGDSEIYAYMDAHFQDTGLFSVRSSSSVEDGETASFAGQFATYLNVPREELLSRIKACFESLYSSMAAIYLEKTGGDAAGLSMSVIVQEMVDAELSGVIFTANPQGLLSETVVVCGAGTGNNVVEDKTPVTTYYYSNIDKLYYYEREPGAPLLGDLLESAVDVSCKLKDIFGELLDIEYAIRDGVLSVLQVRPITTLDPRRPTVLDNSNIVESYPGVSLPLTCSFVKDAYSGVFRGLARRVLKSGRLLRKYDPVLREMVGNANGRMYYKISNWYELIKCLPFSKRIIPVWQEMMGVANKEYDGARQKTPRLQTIRTYVGCGLEFLAVPRNMDRLARDFSGVRKLFEEAYTGSLGNRELLKLYDAIGDAVLKKWDITLLNDLYAFVFTGLFKARLRKLGVENAEEQTNRYLSGIGSIESLKPVRELVSLAVLAVKEGVAGDLADLKDDDKVKAYLKGGNPSFAAAFKRYIRLYGDRSLEELKLESVTFRTSPATLVKKLLEYTGDRDKLARLAEAFSREEAPPFTDGIPHKGGALDRKLLESFSKRAVLGIKNRELSRLNRCRIYGMVRTIFRSMGENLYREGILSGPGDIFYLTVDEVFAAARESGAATEAEAAGKATVEAGGAVAAGTAGKAAGKAAVEAEEKAVGGRGEGLKALIEKRKADYDLYKRLPAFSRLIFAGEVFDKSHRSVNSAPVAAAPGGMKGTPCSGGIVTGEVVVIDRIEAAVHVKDKILVAKMTDPGWVFLLTLAKGIISEKGSLLSHTAIISRELHIPSIVGVKNITEILKTGDTVRMDGSTGEIVKVGEEIVSGNKV
jgi:pyruvate,water dikinase